MRASSLAGLILLAASCTGNDNAALTPAGATGWNDGYPAVVTAFPPGTPAGTVELASFGLVELTAPEQPPIPALHVRVAVANRASERPWNVDIAGATLRIDGSEARTLLANSDLSTLPIALIGRGEARTIDLSFAPPAGIRDDEDLAELDVSVPIAAPGAPVVARAHFVRREPSDVPGARRDVVRVAGWGTRWWADPAHAWPSFHHGPGTIAPRAPEQVAVARLPRWQRPSRLLSALR